MANLSFRIYWKKKKILNSNLTVKEIDYKRTTCFLSTLPTGIQGW